MSGKLAYNLKKIRAVKKLSQKEFAGLFGLTRANIGSYEEGRAHPKLDVLVDIAKYFSINLENLVNNELTVNDILNFGEVENSGDSHLKKIVEEKDGAFVRIPFLDKDELSKYVSLGRVDSNIILPKSFQADLAMEIINTSLTDEKGLYHPGDVLLLRKADFSQINNKSLYVYIKSKKWHYGKLQRKEDGIAVVPLNDLFPIVTVTPQSKSLWEVVYFLGKNRF